MCRPETCNTSAMTLINVNVHEGLKKFHCISHEISMELIISLCPNMRLTSESYRECALVRWTQESAPGWIPAVSACFAARSGSDGFSWNI